MRKNLLFYFLPICLLLGNISLQAKDFTIKGKVSLIQESVPLPFQEVSIADSNGKYVASVKTNFSGKYSFTFDIPDADVVSFEIAVIDQCTSNPIIKAIEKEGTKATVNFIVCNVEDTSDSEEDDEEEEEEDAEETPIWGNLGDLLDCEALGLTTKVCLKNEEGTFTQFDNACEAIEAGHNLTDLELCDGLPIGGSGENIEGIDCEALGIELPIEVCVVNETGESITLLLCEAISEGFTLDEIEFCSDSNLDTLLGLDCDELGIDIPVCAIDTDGNEISYNSPCDALNAGIDIHEINFCGDFDGWEGIGFDNLDCESLDIDLPIMVCVVDANGATQELAICDALTQGMSLEELNFCDGGLGILDSLDCSELGINIPVCLEDENGESISFDNPCDALDAGFDIHQLTICGEIFGEDSIGNFDCESLGLDVEIPVCIVNSAGEQVELMLCEALSEGMDLSSLTLCDGSLDNIDCSNWEIDLPVCSVDADGNELTFDNPCEALAAGLNIHELNFCEGVVDGILEDLDCEILEGIDLPVEVCVTNEAGDQVALNLCDVLEQGISLDQIELCPNAFEEMIDKDCDKLGIDIAVCVEDSEGNKIEFKNPCDALDEGWTISDLSLCDNFIEEAIAAFDLTDTEEIPTIIKRAELYPNPVKNVLNLNLEFTQKAEFEVSIQAINGNAIYRQKFYASNGENVTQVDVSSLNIGIYVIQVVSGAGLSTLKFVKQ